MHPTVVVPVSKSCHPWPVRIFTLICKSWTMDELWKSRHSSTCVVYEYEKLKKDIVKLDFTKSVRNLPSKKYCESIEWILTFYSRSFYLLLNFTLRYWKKNNMERLEQRFPSSFKGRDSKLGCRRGTQRCREKVPGVPPNIDFTVFLLKFYYSGFHP